MKWGRLSKLWVVVLVLLVAVSLWAASSVLNFTWEQPGSDLSSLQGWEIMQSTAAGGPYTLTSTITYTGTPAQSYAATTTLTSPDGQKVTYYFVCRAVNKNGNRSGYSNEVSAIVDFTTPSVPVKFTVTVVPGP